MLLLLSLSCWSSLEIRLRTMILALLRAELLNWEFKFGFGEVSLEIAQKRRMHFLRNLNLIIFLEKGKAVLQLQLQGQIQKEH